MMVTNRNMRMRRGGFTLLEILLVVGLLALLASFAIPALMSQGEKAKIGLAQSAVGSNGPILQAVDLFKFDTGVFPESLKDLVEKPSDDKVGSKWKGPYLKDRAGLIDPWQNEYQYERDGKHNVNAVDLWSNGPDGIEGNDDDIKNWKTDR